MDIYINSTFAQSARGFRMMHLNAEGLTDVRSAAAVPPEIFRFLSEDLFRMIWCDLTDPQSSGKPVPTGSFFGVKWLKGRYDNRKNGTVDIALHAGAAELFDLALLANKLICNYNMISAVIFSVLHIDANGKYHAELQTVLDAIRQLPSGDYPPFVANTAFSYRSARDLLHLAVCIGSRERALQQLNYRETFLHKAVCILDEDDFIEQMDEQ